MTSSASPRVSLGMPVYNGSNFIRAALDSILAQTFTDLEVIVCDNASKDETETIVRQYAVRDPRVRYHRNERNLGPSRNYNVSFELARGQYFKWAAHDDVLEPTYLAETVRVLDENPEVVLAYTDVELIDDRGKKWQSYLFQLEADQASAARRFANLMLVNHHLHRATEIFGLMRSDALRATTLQGCYARGDSVLLARMAMLGRFRKVPQPLFLSREHPGQSMAQKPSSSRLEARLRKWLGVGPIPPPEWWDSSLKGRMVWPEWRIAWEYLRSVWLMPISMGSRMRCAGWYCGWLIRHMPKLARDVIFAVEKLLPRPTPVSAPPSATVSGHPKAEGIVGSGS